MRLMKMSLFGLWCAAMVGTAAQAAGQFVPGEVLVRLKPEVQESSEAVDALYDSFEVKSVKYFEGGAQGLEKWTFAAEADVEAKVRELSADSRVESAQPNYILTIPELSKDAIRPTEDTPCLIPGIPFPPGCVDDPNGGGGGGGGGIPCIVPGLPFPPGCVDDPNGGGGGGSNPPPANRPGLNPRPAPVSPSKDDPNLSKAWGISKVEAPKAWTTNPGNENVVVAVIDTGADYNHEDLAYNMWRNPNPTKNDVVGFDFVHKDGLPYDDQGHGTHTAGTVGAVGGNGIGVSGVAQKVSIMALKFLSAQGSGTTEDAIKAIDYATDNGAKIMSNSWGGGADPGNNELYKAIERAKAKDILFVAAAGNDGKNNDDSSKASYPAGFDNDNLVSVAATDTKDGMASFSNYGKKTTHVGAPGVNVYSLAPGSKYATHSGTSMACPHVAGAAAVIWAANPGWNYKQVKERLMCSSDKVASLNGKTVTGGRINVARALAGTGCP
jgi:subtilisin family serine protease